MSDNRKNPEVEREKFFADLIIDSSRSMVSVINREYVYERVNKTFCISHNTISKKVVGFSLERIWGKDNFNQNIKDNIDRCFSGRVVFYQAFFETPAWGRRYYEVVLRPVTDKSGLVTHVLAETFDITEVKLKEQAASEIEWEFKNLESNLPIGFFRCDLNGVLLHVNKAFLKVLGAQDETDVEGRSLGEFYRDRSMFDDNLSKVINENTKSLGRLVMIDFAGREIICRLIAFVVRDGSGNMMYIDGAIEDFTREEELQRRLTQMQKLDTVGQLAGGIAHDFNTILTTIYGYSELTLDLLGHDSEPYQNIQKIIQAVGRARSLTNQILTFSRQTGQEKINVRLKDIISEAISYLLPSLPGNISVAEQNFDPELVVSADPTQLFRVFINLAGNAVQAMHDTTGKLTISVESVVMEEHPRLKPGRYATIKFSDTGRGMDEQTAQRIFEPFFSTGKEGTGTGLGLSVVYGIISELEGEINVSSSLGKGTDIEILIPAVKSDEPSAGRKEPSTRIMIIPASEGEAKVVAMSLSTAGYGIVLTDRKGEWCRQASESDLVIVFDQSPSSPASEAIFSLSEAGVKTPVLVVSEFDVWLSDIKDLSSDSVKANIFKPVSLKEIVFSIDNIINRKS